MEKTLQQQYVLIKEGKGSKDDFLKSARRIFPDYIAPTTDFKTAVHILKNKSILNEGVGGIVTQSPQQPDWFKIFDTNLKEAIKEETYALSNQEIKEKSPITNMSIIDMYNLLSEIDDIDFIQEIGIIISRKDWNNRGEFAVKQKIYREIQKRIDDQNIIDDLEEEIYRLMKASSKELNEAIGVKNTKEYGNQNSFDKIDKEVEAALSHQFDNKDTKNIDNVYGQSFLMGYYTEMKDPKNEGKTVDELKQIVLKNMTKDINYYHTEASFGVKGIGYKKDVVGGGEPKAPKGKYKSSGYGDLKENQSTRSVGPMVKSKEFKVVKEGIHDRDILSRPSSNPYVEPLERSPEDLGKDADNRSENMLRLKYYKEIKNPAISDDELRYILGGKGVKGFGGRPNAIEKIINNRNLNESETRSVGPMVKPEGFQVGDKVKYKGMNHEVTRIVDDRIYIKNLKYAGRPDTWVKAVDLKKSIKEITSNTSKLFNWFWSSHESAKEIQRRIREMSDESLLFLLDNEPSPSKLNTPRKIQVALLKKEIDRRKLNTDLNENKDTDLKIYQSELNMLNKIKPTGEKQLKRKKELEDKIASLQTNESKLRSLIHNLILEELNEAKRPAISTEIKEIEKSNETLEEEIKSLKEQLKFLEKHLKWCKDNNKPQEQCNTHVKVINDIREEIKELEDKIASLNESKRPAVSTEIKEIEKSNEALALEAKIKSIDEAIEKRQAKLNLAESEELAEMIDKNMVKTLQKEIKELEKYKAKASKMYEKMTGSAKKEVIDETLNESKLRSVIRNLINEELENQEKYIVIRSGGSIGEKEFKKEFNSKEEAMDYARRMNKQLSPGEKSFYKIRYNVRKAKPNELNENFGRTTYLSLDDAKFEAQRISDEEGVVQHVEETSEGSGEYRVSDWYDSDLTVVSYENGMEL